MNIARHVFDRDIKAEILRNFSAFIDQVGISYIRKPRDTL